MVGSLSFHDCLSIVGVFRLSGLLFCGGVLVSQSDHSLLCVLPDYSVEWLVVLVPSFLCVLIVGCHGG